MACFELMLFLSLYKNVFPFLVNVYIFESTGEEECELKRDKARHLGIPTPTQKIEKEKNDTLTDRQMDMQIG